MCVPRRSPAASREERCSIAGVSGSSRVCLRTSAPAPNGKGMEPMPDPGEVATSTLPPLIAQQLDAWRSELREEEQRLLSAIDPEPIHVPGFIHGDDERP